LTSFSKHIGKYSLIALFFILLQSCETPEKVLKSNDLDYKIKTATAWYNKKQYVKCIPVFEELMGLLKGTKSTEDIYYMYCMSNYRQGDYLIAAYHFNNFGKLYPNSPKAEECSYMAARSHQKLSPKYQLDQTNTYKAIETYQTFVNLYPESNRVDSANIEFQKLKKKLEFKAVKNAELYYKTENYKAAATSFKNLLVDYPDVDNPDYVYYMIVKSYDKYAGNSVAYKKAERYRDVAKSYDEFVYRFPKSKYIAQGKKIAEDSHFNTVMGASELMNTVRLDEKPREYPKAIREIETQIPLIANEKQKKKAQQILEKTYLQWMKNDVLLAEEAKPEQKINLYEQSIKNYYTFVDKYKGSSYVKAAEKNFLQASDKLKKLKENGQKQTN
jgi:outer membrane protein assembly factor BamD